MAVTIPHQHVVICGGGLAGCLSALAIHASYPRVEITLLEQRTNLLNGSSSITPGRMGLGFHYLLNLDTAMMYLEETIGFMRSQLSDHQGRIQDKFIIGEVGSKLRKGRYFFISQAHTIRQCTKEADRILLQLRARLTANEDDHDTVVRSQALDGAGNTDGYASFTRERITASLESLKHRYRELVTNDLLNAVVGPVDEFYRPLNIAEYSSLVNTQLIDTAIETQECLLNWPEYERHVRRQLHNLQRNKYLTVLTEHDVTDVKTMGAAQLFQVFASNDNQAIEIFADAVINCTWHNVEWVARSIPSPYGFTPMTTRVKMLCRVLLPHVLGSAPSMFFGMGAHCMFSNLGDGTGFITYAPVTNAFSSQAQHLPDEWLHRLQYGLSDAEQQLYGEAIIEGVSFYIPAMKTCKLLHCAVGAVKSRGNVDIYNSNSDHHAREEHGVDCVYSGFVNNAAMKLFYADSNARRTVQKLASLLKD